MQTTTGSKTLLKRLAWTAIILLTAWAFNALLSKRYPAPAIAGKKQQSSSISTSNRIRVATWNIHTGKGTDKKRDLKRISDAIEQNGPFDIMGLQEISGPTIFGKPNQAEILADNLKMESLFAPTEYRWLQFNQGNALLSINSPSEFQSISLPYFISLSDSETKGRSYRNLLEATIPHQSGDIAVMVTHLDTSVVNSFQLDFVFKTFSDSCSRHARCILLADLNNEHDSDKLRSIIEKYQLLDATEQSSQKYQGRNVDWILAKGFALMNSGFVDKGPSDHGLFWADLELTD